MKRSFILHMDSLSILDEMTNEQKGMLFDAIYKYHLGEELKLDFAMKMAFAPFRNQFIRDRETYYNVIDRNRENGKLGGRPRKTQENPKNPSGLLKTQENPKNLDNDNDSNSDSESVNVSDLKSLPMFDKITNIDFLQMCRKVSDQKGRLTDLDQYKKEYFRLLANRKELHEQSGRSEEWLVINAKKFIKEQSAINKEYDNYADFFSHFLNWTRKQPK